MGHILQLSKINCNKTKSCKRYIMLFSLTNKYDPRSSKTGVSLVLQIYRHATGQRIVDIWMGLNC